MNDLYSETSEAETAIVAPSRSISFAYADPPYFGLAALYADRHADALDYNRIETHAALIDRMCREFPDGWAMSLHTPSLRDILQICPADVRIAAWTKPFASFKPGVNPGYCWEPVVFRGGRKRTKRDLTVRDYIAEPITLRRGFIGAKPERFCWWIFELMGARPGDDFHDLFPGSGAVTRAWSSYCTEQLFSPAEGAA